MITRESNLDRFITSQKRGSFAAVWSDVTWPLKATPTIESKSHGRISFVTRSTPDGEPFDQPFADFARAVMSAFDHSRLKKPTQVPYSTLLYALRSLDCVTRSTGFDATELSGATFTRAHRLYSSEHGPTQSNRVGYYLRWLIELLNRSGITAIPSWSFEVRKVDQLPSQDDLLTEVQLRALAMVSNAELQPSERLTQLIIEIMMIGGFRPGEAVTLPRDTWCEEAQFDEYGDPLLDGSGRPVVFHGLRYWAEKTGSGVAMIKPLPTEIAPRARRLVEQALALTHRAWVVARHQAITGTTTLGSRWDNLPDDALMSDVDVMHAIGLACSGKNPTAGKGWIRNQRIEYVVDFEIRSNQKAARWMVRKGDVYARLVHASHHGNCRPDRRYEPIALHELLFIKSYRGVEGTARMATHVELRCHLGSDRPSIFDRLGITDEGAKIQVRPKQFRSSLNVAAIRGGLSDVMVARAFGRKLVALNDAYDRRSADEKEEEVRDRMEIGGFLPKLDMPMRPPVPRFAPLVQSGRAGLLTSVGTCYHNYAESPCAAHAAMVAAGFDDLSLDTSSDDGWRMLREMEDQLAEATRESDAYGRKVWIGTLDAAITALRSRLDDGRRDCRS